MKKAFLPLIILGMLFIGINSSSAFNFKYFQILLPPTPTATINVTVDLGQLTCEALECQYWHCQIYYVIGSTYTPVGNSQQYDLFHQTYYFLNLCTCEYIFLRVKACC